MMTLRILARLLAYPTAELQQAAPEMSARISRESGLPQNTREALLTFVSEVGERPLTALQEDYVSLFDRGRHLSLHLFEHVHGESRDRGQAMVDLMAHYHSQGYMLDARELPDYIPLFLEYLSTCERQEISAMLSDAMPVLVLLGARLQEKGSGYASIFDTLEAIGGSCEDADSMRRQAASEAPDETLEKMDQIWEEEQVTFMGNNDPAGGGCGATQPPPQGEVPLQRMDHPRRHTARQG